MKITVNVVLTSLMDRRLLTYHVLLAVTAFSATRHQFVTPVNWMIGNHLFALSQHIVAGYASLVP